MVQESLSQLYTSYLSANLATDAAVPLVGALRRAGLRDEADALQMYVERGPVARFTITNGLWAGRDCIVSDCHPAESEPGTLWFDVTELTHMIDVQTEQMNYSYWLAGHPVYVWQFKAFLALVDWRRIGDSVAPDDLMSSQRFERVDETAFVVDIYQEEAETYAFWFRKWLSSPGVSEGLKDFLPQDVYASLMPSDMSLWLSGPAEPINEVFREAVGYAKPDIDISTCSGRLLRGEYASPRDVPGALRYFYDVWERSGQIGLMTRVTAHSSFMKKPVSKPPERGIPVCWYEVAIRNFAPRPSLGVFL